MKRISTAFLLAAATLTGGLPAAHAQNSPGWFPFRLGNRQRAAVPASYYHAVQTAAPVGAQPVFDPSVDLASAESRPVVFLGAVTGPAGPAVQSVNAPSLAIDFEVRGVGTSGVGHVELWYTRDGQRWSKFQGAPQMQSPLAVDVVEDGLYGFTVVARNGMGIGKAPPTPGEPPQIWVDVDTTRPEVHLLQALTKPPGVAVNPWQFSLFRGFCQGLLGTQAGSNENGRTLTMRWTATDRNLVPRPITLSYAESPQGPWIPFATNLENNGHYTWNMSPGLPSQLLVRVSAIDRVGNIGEDQSSMPAPVDPTPPTTTIRNVSRNGGIQPTEGPGLLPSQAVLQPGLSGEVPGPAGSLPAARRKQP
jgi:hypothetical protein